MYGEYEELHNYIQSISDVFIRLKNEIEKIQDIESIEFRDKEKEIVREYRKFNSSEYTGKKDRYNYLYDKLEHLRKLIHKYDAGGSWSAHRHENSLISVICSSNL